jgi:NAD(P)-dependent dehydrogenase (short-subunit alcohol dehydrogenase family)
VLINKMTYATNVFGAVRVTQAFLPLLRASDAPIIVNVSSDLGSFAQATAAPRPSTCRQRPIRTPSPAASSGRVKSSPGNPITPHHAACPWSSRPHQPAYVARGLGRAQPFDWLTWWGRRSRFASKAAVTGPIYGSPDDARGGHSGVVT